MRKLFLFGVLAILLSMLSSPVVAAVEDCEILKGDGGARGLYGMCIAYWRSVENHGGNGSQDNRLDENNRFLNRYNHIRDRFGGPEMPGLETSPKLACACWSYLTFDEAGAGSVRSEYIPAPGGIFEILYFYDDSDINIRGFAVGSINNSCSHTNSVDGTAFTVNVEPFGLSDDETFQCQAELQELAGVE